MRPLVLLLTACAPTDEACGPGRICAIVGSGDLGFDGEGLPAAWTRLASPTSVLTDEAGRPMVVDFSNMRLRVLMDDRTVRTVVGDGRHAYSEIGADRLATPLENPVDAAWGPDGHLYVLPMHEGRVLRIDDDDRVQLWVGTGVLADNADECQASEAEMGYAGGLAFARDGTLFVSDNTFSKVRRVSPTGWVTTVLGTSEPGDFTPGYGPETTIHAPERLVVDDERGRLLVAATLDHRVLSVDLETLQVEVLAGNGERGWSGDGGSAVDASLDSPVGLAVGPDGTVLIADLGNDVLRAVALDGSIHTVAGTGDGAEPVPHADPLAFPMRQPAGMAWTPDGDLLIAERGGNRVLRWYGAPDEGER